MKFKYVVYGLLGLLGILGVIWAVQGNSFFLYKAFAPAQEQARREVFKESQAYNDGMANEIDAAYLQYQKADAEGKGAIRSVVLRRVASYDVSRLPDYLQRFINDLRQTR